MTILGNLVDNPKLRTTVGKLIEEAKFANDERRRNGRYPFFAAVRIQLNDNPELYSAFTRDISLSGVGLLHWMPVPPQNITMISKLSGGESVSMMVNIVWCVPCGDGWYISGGQFLSVEN